MTDQANDRPESINQRPPAVQQASAEDWLGSNRDPDVLLSVPDLGVDRITLDVEDVHARVDLHARVLDIVELHVGATVDLGKVELDIENVRAQAMLKVKLDKVAEIVERVMETIDNNPELITSLTSRVGRGIEELGRGAGQGVREIASHAGSAHPQPEATTPPPITAYRDVAYDEAVEPALGAGQGEAGADRSTRRVRPAVAEPVVVETFRGEDGWWNRVGDDEEIGPYDSKDDAIEEGREIAAKEAGEHVVRTRSGRVSRRFRRAARRLQRADADQPAGPRDLEEPDVEEIDIEEIDIEEPDVEEIDAAEGDEAGTGEAEPSEELDEPDGAEEPDDRQEGRPDRGLPEDGQTEDG